MAEVPKCADLARRAVACPRWRWMPGMLALDSCNEEHPARVIDGRRSAVYEDTDGATHEGVVSRSDVPDLTDPATLGCLLALVREAWGDPCICTAVDNTSAGWWVDGWTAARPQVPSDLHPTEAAALVAALEAAP